MPAAPCGPFVVTRAGPSNAPPRRLTFHARQRVEIEAGQHDSARALTAYARALGADVKTYVRWHGGDLDRLVNRRHAAMHEQMARVWPDLPSWIAVPEVTFSVFGERGIVDWVAWHAETGTLLLVELKTEIVDVNDLLGTANRRIRLARQIAEPYGWVPRRVAYWLAIEDDRTNRRHLARYATVLRSAFPEDGHAIRRWLREPDRPIRCLSFMSIVQPERRRQPRATLAGPMSMTDESRADLMTGPDRPDHVEMIAR